MFNDSDDAGRNGSKRFDKKDERERSHVCVCVCVCVSHTNTSCIIVIQMKCEHNRHVVLYKQTLELVFSLSILRHIIFVCTACLVNVCTVYCFVFRRFTEAQFIHFCSYQLCKSTDMGIYKYFLCACYSNSFLLLFACRISSYNFNFNCFFI